MPTRMNRRMWFGGVFAAGAAIALMAAKPSTPDLPCEVAERWVSEHRASLPTTLTAFSEYSMLYRRAAYRALAVEHRRNLWREHLNSFLEPESRLTATQQRVVRGVLAELDRYVDTPAIAQVNMTRDGLPARIRAEFGDSLGAAVFATLGSGQPSPSAPGAVVGCNCSLSWGCIGSSTCESGTGCTQTESGCGYLWCWPCNGECRQNET